MGRTDAENRPRSSTLRRPLVCEECGGARASSAAGWVLLWLDEVYQPLVMLTYCPPCANLGSSFGTGASAPE
jgi:hypothetical protein